MYKAYYAPLPNREAYLRRLGLEEAPAPTLENLGRLLTAHVTKIPFENLTVCREKQVPDLTVEALYRKIVEEKRGGWCFELNGLFCVLLQELGYEVYPVGARVTLRHPEPGPVDHRAAVCIIDGRKYLADVGFGAVLSFHPIPLDGSETPDGLWMEQVSGSRLALYRREGGEKRMLLLVDDIPMAPVDFIPANFYMATVPGGHFQQGPVVNLRTIDGRKQLSGREFQVTGREPMPLADEAAFRQVLREEFGIVL